VAAVAGGLIATFSRGSWFAALVAPLALVLAGQGRFAFRFALAVALGGGAVDSLSGGLLRDRLAAALVAPSGVERLGLMLAGILMFLESPWVGVGPGGFPGALELVGLRVPGLWDFLDTAHNTFLHAAAEGGAVFLGALLLFLGVATVRIVRGARAPLARPGMDVREASLRRTLLHVLATALLLGLFEWTWIHGIGQILMVTVAIASTLRDPGEEAS